MPSGKITVTKILGLNPAQDARQFSAPTLLDGQNVLIDAQGVYSAFAEELISEAVIADPNKMTTIRIGTFIIDVGVGAFFRYDQDSQRYYSVFEFSDNDEDYPWSTALVGGIYYFAKFGVDGVISYNPNTEVWCQNDVSGDIPDAVYGICTSGGRLIVQSRNLTTNSDIDFGLNLATNVNTGAGAQSASVYGGGVPLGVYETVQGYMAFTKTGIASFTLVNTTIPFRYQRIDTTEMPLNPFVITTVKQGMLVYLAKVGFQQTQGKVPEIYQPLMSEYFTRTLFRQLDLSVQTILRMSFNEDRQWLLVSISSRTNPYIYTIAYCLYLPMDQWGVFNEAHYSFGEFDLASGPFAGFNFGFIDDAGRAHRFIETPRREETAQTEATRYFRPSLDPPVRIVDTVGDDDPADYVYHFGCMGILDVVPISLFGEMPGVFEFAPDIIFDLDPDPIEVPTEEVIGEGILEFIDWMSIPDLTDDEDWLALSGSEDWDDTGIYWFIFQASGGLATRAEIYVWMLADHNYTSINSFADIGLMRLDDGVYADRLSDMQLLVLGTDLQQIFEYLDYEDTDEPDEDWDTDTDDEDWGNDIPTSNEFSVNIKGTIDGENVFQGNEVDDPSNNYKDGSTIIYPFQTAGIWHRVRVSALNDNESFHLKTLEMQGTLAGRLF